MIESISISNIATFNSNTIILDGLSKFNYFYGSNGTGKTSISRLIDNESIFSSCSIKCKRNKYESKL